MQNREKNEEDIEADQDVEDEDIEVNDEQAVENFFNMTQSESDYL